MEEEKILYHSKGISTKRRKMFKIAAIWFGVIALGFLIAAVIGFTIGYTEGYFEAEGGNGWTVVNGVAYQNIMNVEVRRYSSERDKSLSSIYLVISLLFAANCWSRIKMEKKLMCCELTLYTDHLEYSPGITKGVQKISYRDLEKADCLTARESIKLTRKSTNAPIIVSIAGNPEEPMKIFQAAILSNHQA